MTHGPADPNAVSTIEMMEALGADPLYVRLCRAQECFRARLTPKPWRVGHYAMVWEYPWVNDRERSAVQSWKREYEAKTQGFATCELIGNWLSADRGT